MKWATLKVLSTFFDKAVYYTQRKVWLEEPQFRLFQPEKNATESHTINSV